MFCLFAFSVHFQCFLSIVLSGFFTSVLFNCLSLTSSLNDLSDGKGIRSIRQGSHTSGKVRKSTGFLVKFPGHGKSWNITGP